MSDPTEPTLDADDCESGEPSWPRLVAANMSDLYGTGPNDVNVGWSWCVYDPDETDPPIAENIVMQEFAEELARRWNEHDHLLATLAEKDRRIGELEAIAEAATEYEELSRRLFAMPPRDVSLAVARHHSAARVKLQSALARLDQGGTANGSV